MVCGYHVNCLVIDYDNVTGIMRGLVCARHNLALKRFNGDINALKRAIDYLSSFKEEVPSKPISKPLINDDIRAILNDSSFKSDRQRAKALSLVYSMTYTAIQSRISRERKRMRRTRLDNLESSA